MIVAEDFVKLQRRFLNLDYYLLSVISNLYSNGCLSRFFRFYNALEETVATFLLLDVNLTFPVTSFFTTVMVVEVFPLV